MRAVIHEHGDLQACVVARLRNEFIDTRLYERKQRKTCEAERPGVAVEECAVLGSWQLTSPSVATFGTSSRHLIRSYFSFSPPQAFCRNYSQTDLGMNAHCACCTPAWTGTLTHAHGRYNVPGSCILRGWGRARSLKLRPRVSLPRSPVGHKVLVCTMRRTWVPF